MSKIIFPAFIIAAFLLISEKIIAQPGTDCNDPHIINSIPFVQTGLTTQGFGNDYGSSSCCNSVYMTGNDYVFRYTPGIDININVIVSNTGLGTGVFITDKCPDDTAANCIAMNEAQNGNPEINVVQLMKDSTYYILVSTYNLFNMNPITNFNILIKESMPFDAGVYSFHNRSDCELTNNVPITIEIKNYGYDTLSNIPLAYEINGGAAVVDTFYGDLLPQEVEYFTFQTYADMSIAGVTYDIIAYTLQSLDGDIFNDSLVTHITHSIYANAPYYESFESGANGWVTDRINSSLSLSSWEYGVPNGTIIDTAATGNNAWVTNLSGNNNPYEKSFVLSPCFDLSSFVMPIFEFNIWYETEDLDYIILAYALDNGYTWTSIGNSGDPNNWYNGTVGGYDGWNGSSGGWLNAKHVLNNLAGISKVQFRIYFEGGVNGTNEGFAFDDVKIYESPLNDLSIVNIIYPDDGCGFSSNEDITIRIANSGLYDQNNFNLNYSIDGGNTFVTETYTDTLLSKDTLIYTFTTQADLSIIGFYNIIAVTGLSNDDNNTNDTLLKTIYHFNTINTFPYQEDFESNNGGWFAKGFRSSWEYGTPTDSIINHAASGNNAWVTNLSGVHNDAEQSFLYTPCFDFSNLSKPKVKINIWYEIEPQGVKFEYSINGGQTWLNYGDTVGNWYNQGHNWIGHSNGWVNVERDLYIFAGEPQIQFRFTFIGLSMYPGFAVDDFIICDEPTSSFSYQQNGLEITFTDESIFSDFYYWDFGDTAYSTAQNPIHIYNYPDTFIVMHVVNGLCGTDTSYQSISTVGIDQLEIRKFEIFPNPTSNAIYIKTNTICEKTDFEIIDQYGNIALKGCFRGFKTIQLNFLNKGFYYLKLYSDNDIIIEKLVIL